MRASRTLPAAAAANNKTSSVAQDALSQSGSLPFTDAEVNTSHLRYQRRKPIPPNCQARTSQR
jgi:hypothetical protein